jgi:uncharacterized protein YbcC (UPF0753/DUF2309 family)
MTEKNYLKENLISALGIESLSDEKKASLIEKMAELTEKRIILRLMEELPESAHQEFEKIAGEGDQIKIQFLQERVPNLREIIQEEVGKVKKEILEQGEKIDQELKEA